MPGTGHRPCAGKVAAHVDIRPFDRDRIHITVDATAKGVPGGCDRIPAGDVIGGVITFRREPATDIDICSRTAMAKTDRSNRIEGMPAAASQRAICAVLATPPALSKDTTHIDIRALNCDGAIPRIFRHAGTKRVPGVGW